ncbi:vanillate O-demethylase monooxygenase subunit [Pusillimonas noertemannii]|uniref:Vanillate O-demethylase monooxygenase subunit n=2 Tax=Pusillimonas noertemannii TaxID=305977 RepID=A0A2U1CK85_9BURK|nr:aromatic ring-hydroxylating dioxygenase subunit alpha [Pusillimonas noertemannii]PVY61429.1 vanillate O-demethylase monooxygenase subunit [Pusillimonas noertemannii]
MSNFLRNTWYAVGWSSEITGDLFSRTLLNESILIYRLPDGSPVALDNRCPHRFAPLDCGKLLADGVVQCGYHGLKFDRTGHCIANPMGKGKVPSRTKVRSYPIIERHQLLWIWMGHPDAADPASIPDYSYITDDSLDQANIGNYLRVQANYQLIIDNLMDLTHVGILHEGSLGNESMLAGQLELVESGNDVCANLWMPQSEAPPYLRNRGPIIDQWLDMRWTCPSSLSLNIGGTASGEPIERPSNFNAIHILTPETEYSTHYFYGTHGRLNPDDTIEQMRKLQTHAFLEEDLPMIEKCAAMMGPTQDFWASKPILLESDAAAVRSRRILDRAIAQEAASTCVAHTTE